ncbi:Stp1/IreP family PP2C-type Ser/Thr phosphatase [Planctomycetota bacterium]|nr:Stp1/IreP family PP2C-type Ser/Thr phosphatase [Planctomycetota bacterium]
MKIREDIALGQHSHVGMARTENQDFFGYWEPDDDRAFDLKGRLVVVCDGMGGHAGGEIASRMAVKTVIETYEAADSDNIMDTLRKAIEDANHVVYSEGKKPGKEVLAGMGTTATAIVHRRDMIYFGQVGDSRAYLIRGNQIQQMTKDHSLVQQLVDEGLLEKDEMENHPDKNVILRSLGVKSSVEVDISYAPIAAGDMYLLCSDGLTGLVSDDEVLKIVMDGMNNGEGLRKVCEALVDRANQYGGHDNITVQILQVNQTDSATTDTTEEATVTAQFTPDQVQASIAKAREEAAASGKDVSAPAPSENASLPATQATIPTPVIADAPAPAGGGGTKLVMGLAVGLLVGAGGLFVGLKTKVIPPSAVGATAAGASGDSAAAEQFMNTVKTQATRAQAAQLAPEPFQAAEAAAAAATDTSGYLGAAQAYMEAAAEARTQAKARLAEQAGQVATTAEAAAREGQTGVEELDTYQKGQEHLTNGNHMVEQKRFDEARAHFRTAAALFELSGGE